MTTLELSLYLLCFFVLFNIVRFSACDIYSTSGVRRALLQRQMETILSSPSDLPRCRLSDSDVKNFDWIFYLLQIIARVFLPSIDLQAP